MLKSIPFFWVRMAARDKDFLLKFEKEAVYSVSGSGIPLLSAAWRGYSQCLSRYGVRYKHRQPCFCWKNWFYIPGLWSGSFQRMFRNFSACR